MSDPVANVKTEGAPAGGDGARTESAPKQPIKAKGLEGVVALDTEMSFIDGQKGILIYRGYSIEDLAEHTTFEECAYLMWHGKLPNRRELDELSQQLAANRQIPGDVLDLIRRAPKDANPMHVLRTAVSALSVYDPEADDMSPEANLRKSIRLTAQTPTIIAAYDRIRKGKEVVAPSSNPSTAFDFLYQLNGEEPGPSAVRTFDACLVTHVEHGLAASTFAARVVGSTLADIYSSVVAAIAGLKGPLHGGANIEVMHMLEEIDKSGKDPVEYVKERLGRKERIMGFGHRVYKVFDPRAKILRKLAVQLSEERGQKKWYEISIKIMETVEKEKKLYPNVDFFSASVYHMLGIDTDLFTPIFALARMAGWTAHMLEQWKENRLIRPSADYVGPWDLKVVPIDQRS